MKVLVENFKCVVSEEEYHRGEATGYPFVFIVGNDGALYKETALTHGRFVRTRIKHLPDSKPSTLKENINFLPAGKIPIVMLHQVVAFFREVMATLKAGPEAMIHILWNPKTGYRLSVPSQRVSKAAVSYDYDNLNAADGDIIVVDIHSHNTMGAFFSGTDDRDDRTSICYSGVIGQLDKPTPAMKFRFNNNQEKFECQLEDIFSTGVENVSVPKEWLDKVDTKAPVYSGGYGGYGGYGGHGYNQRDRGKDLEDWMDRMAGRENYSLGKGKGVTPQDAADLGTGRALNPHNSEKGHALTLEELENMTDEELDEYSEQYLQIYGDPDSPLGLPFIEDDSEEEESFEQVLVWLDSITSPDKIQEILEECKLKLDGEIVEPPTER